MATSTVFYLKEPQQSLKAGQKKTETLVYMVFNFNYCVIDQQGQKNYKPLKYSTGEKIHPDHWDFEKQQARQGKAFPAYREFNSRIKSIQTITEGIHRRMLNDGLIPTPDSLRVEVDKATGKAVKVVASPLSFFSFVEAFIKEESRKSNTLRSYTTTLNRLRYYSKFTASEMVSHGSKKPNELLKIAEPKATRKHIDFDTINLGFYYDFLKWNKDQGKSLNYIGTLIKNIKTFLTEATERGINKNLEYLSKKFKVLSEDTDSIYLTEKDISALFKVDLSHRQALDRTRDLFVISCHTGLRFQDFTQLKPENFIKTDEGELIKVRTGKTGKEVAIPMHWRVKEIVGKYNGLLPRAVTNQKMNEHLKDIGELAEVNEKVSIGKTRGGLWVEVSKHKHELISCHTGRRTALTNMFMSGIPSGQLRLISGHSTEKSFLRYIKMTAEDNAVKLLNNPYFHQLKAV